MASFKLIRCYIKIQLCIGHFPDGRMRTRTFGIGGVRPDLSADDVAAVARALTPLLTHPIVQVRFVRKYALSARKAPAARRTFTGRTNPVRQKSRGLLRDTQLRSEAACAVSDNTRQQFLMGRGHRTPSFRSRFNFRYGSRPP